MQKLFYCWAVVVAQLAEWLLKTPEVYGPSQEIRKIFAMNYWKDDNKEKEAGNGSFKKIL